MPPGGASDKSGPQAKWKRQGREEEQEEREVKDQNENITVQNSGKW